MEKEIRRKDIQGMTLLDVSFHMEGMAELFKWFFY